MKYTADRRKGNHVEIVNTDGNTTLLTPQPSQEIVNHSPTGFNWGYGGSGPAQLALAILLDVAEDAQIAQRLYQDFKWKVIAHLPDAWELEKEDIQKWIIERKTKPKHEVLPGQTQLPISTQENARTNDHT